MTPTLSQDVKEFIELLNSNEVQYVIVGGYAVAYHGYPRMTGDIDFFVGITEQNAQQLLNTLSQFGFASLGLTKNDFLSPQTIIQLGYPPNRIDIITSVDGVNFAEAWQTRIITDFDSVKVNILDKHLLIINKRHSGRLKDLQDVERLQ